MPRLVSKADLARMAGVSRAAVTKAGKGKLSGACEADRVDLDHPAVKKFLSGRKPAKATPAGARTGKPKPPASVPRAPTSAPTPAPKRSPAPTAPGPQEGESGSSSDLDAYAALLAPLTERFGTARNFRDWLLALKDLEVVRAKRLANEETEGRLISRSLVKTHVLGTIEAGNRRLLNDAPKTMARRVYSASKSGAPVEEAEQIIREIMTSQLAPVKATAARLLRDEE